MALHNECSDIRVFVEIITISGVFVEIITIPGVFVEQWLHLESKEGLYTQLQCNARPEHSAHHYIKCVRSPAPNVKAVSFGFNGWESNLRNEYRGMKDGER